MPGWHPAWSIGFRLAARVGAADSSKPGLLVGSINNPQNVYFFFLSHSPPVCSTQQQQFFLPLCAAADQAVYELAVAAARLFFTSVRARSQILAAALELNIYFKASREGNSCMNYLTSQKHLYERERTQKVASGWGLLACETAAITSQHHALLSFVVIVSAVISLADDSFLRYFEENH